MERDRNFGFTEEDFKLLTKLLNKKKYPQTESRVKTKYPYLNDEEVKIAATIINSPIKNTFTDFDLAVYLKKLNPYE
jgi:hypothetical protein